MKTKILPPGFEPDAPWQVMVMRNGTSVGVPYMVEGSERIRYDWHSFLTPRQAGDFLEKAASEAESVDTWVEAEND